MTLSCNTYSIFNHRHSSVLRNLVGLRWISFEVLNGSSPLGTIFSTWDVRRTPSSDSVAFRNQTQSPLDQWVILPFAPYSTSIRPCFILPTLLRKLVGFCRPSDRDSDAEQRPAQSDVSYIPQDSPATLVVHMQSRSGQMDWQKLSCLSLLFVLPYQDQMLGPWKKSNRKTLDDSP
ncbi:hypothetical protein JAAARDRAFT_250201 [Jaapia argillacea MUCL 33604]|uniref:Uncharacterized protein n=1 Tax=Jaapia argillacea MUCL 33604 TaxID=933084 RepID=A0A067PSZ3_9AGAM|nr:hypothetical protein JAAARDRAFT_250201 [Jaapia argillacea MUCL 33604]